MSSIAQRVRAHRARRRAGRTVLLVEIDEVAWADILVRLHMLDPNNADDGKALAIAMQRFLEVAADLEGN